MNEIIDSILRGCRLAKDLESNLPNIANQPNLLSGSCDEIIKTFLTARERLNAQAPSLFFPQIPYPDVHAQQVDPSLQQWLRCSVTQAMEEMIQTQLLADKSPFTVRGHEMEATSTRSRGTVGDFQAADVSDSGITRGSSSSLRHRRSENARTVRVPAPRIGNTEVPPEDGFTWRKYGQKEILNSKFPRSYYRCTHQKLYQCPAKKQVQRLDDDPFTFEVTYNGDHTCHISSTAPSVPPSAAEMTQTITMQTSPTNLGRWLSMDLGAAGGSGSSSMVGGYSTGGDAGPSTPTVRCDQKDGDQCMVASLADAMFNSGSSSSNSMEFLFTSMDAKWPKPEDKKD